MGNSFLLIVVGLLIFYLVISDKWKCVELFAACVTGKTNAQTNTASPTNAPIGAPTAPQIIKPPTFQTLALNSNLMLGGYGI